MLQNEISFINYKSKAVVFSLGQGNFDIFSTLKTTLMNPEITIWHNNQCSTSRKTLDLIQHHSENIEVRNYLQKPPTITELKKVLKMMGEKPEFILRKKDKIFLELFADKELSDEEWLRAMKQHPAIIERPIIIIGKKAYLARPFEEFVARFKEMF